MGCVGAVFIGFFVALFMTLVTDAGFLGFIGWLLISPIVVFIMVGMVSKS